MGHPGTSNLELRASEMTGDELYWMRHAIHVSLKLHISLDCCIVALRNVLWLLSSIVYLGHNIKNYWQSLKDSGIMVSTRVDLLRVDCKRLAFRRNRNFILISRWVAKCVRQKVAVVPAMLSPAHIEMWTGLFFHTTVKSTLSFVTQNHCQA